MVPCRETKPAQPFCRERETKATHSQTANGDSERLQRVDAAWYILLFNVVWPDLVHVRKSNEQNQDASFPFSLSARRCLSRPLTPRPPSSFYLDLSLSSTHRQRPGRPSCARRIRGKGRRAVRAGATRSTGLSAPVCSATRGGTIVASPAKANTKTTPDVRVKNQGSRVKGQHDISLQRVQRWPPHCMAGAAESC